MPRPAQVRSRRWPRVDDDVMEDFGIAGFHLECLDPFVFREVGRDLEILIRDFAVGGNRIVLTHRKHRVRGADRPAAFVRGLRGQIGGFPFRRAAVGPAHQRRLVRLAQTTVVEEFAVLRIGMPWRHRAFADLRGNGFRPRPRILEGQQRHRRNLARPMAVRAVLIEDRRDFLAERRHGGGRLRCLAGRRYRDGGRRAECQGRHRSALPSSFLVSGGRLACRALGAERDRGELHFLPRLVTPIDILLGVGIRFVRR